MWGPNLCKVCRDLEGAKGSFTFVLKELQNKKWDVISVLELYTSICLKSQKWNGRMRDALGNRSLFQNLSKI